MYLKQHTGMITYGRRMCAVEKGATLELALHSLAPAIQLSDLSLIGSKTSFLHQPDATLQTPRAAEWEIEMWPQNRGCSNQKGWQLVCSKLKHKGRSTKHTFIWEAYHTISPKKLSRTSKNKEITDTSFSKVCLLLSADRYQRLLNFVVQWNSQ